MIASLVQVCSTVRVAGSCACQYRSYRCAPPYELQGVVLASIARTGVLHRTSCRESVLTFCINSTSCACQYEFHFNLSALNKIALALYRSQWRGEKAQGWTGRRRQDPGQARRGGARVEEGWEEGRLYLRSKTHAVRAKLRGGGDYTQSKHHLRITNSVTTSVAQGQRGVLVLTLCIHPTRVPAGG